LTLFSTLIAVTFSASSLVRSTDDNMVTSNAIASIAKNIDVLRERRVKQGVQKFYNYQNYLAECYQKDAETIKKDHRLQERQTENERTHRWESILTKSTVFCNIAVLLAKTVAGYLSNSLSVMSTVVDSAMDIACGGIIWLTDRKIEKTNRYAHPRRREHLEPLVVIIVAMVMIFANLIIIGRSIESVIQQTVAPRVDYITLSILIMGTVIKLVLFVLCYRQKTSSACRTLAQDQRNDVMTNVIALIGAYCGQHYWLYADPLGAVCISSFIIVSWYMMARDEVPLLIGKTASQAFINRLVRLSITHDNRIRGLDTLTVYHFGKGFIVELHVLMDRMLPLHESHDVAETLTVKLERVEFVERAFVHCDYKYDGDGHLNKHAWG
jgi:cation diffusion facilitator family transporter